MRVLTIFHISSLITFVLLITFVSLTTIFISNNYTTHCGLLFDDSRRTIIETLTSETIEQLEGKRSLSMSNICEMPVAKLQRSLVKLSMPKPDHPGEAKYFRYLQQLSSNKQFNINQWYNTISQVFNKRQRENYSVSISSKSWEHLGPGNIGGRIRSIAFDPDNATNIYLGSVSGGIWMSENSGGSWSPVNDFMANLSVSALIFDPINSNIIYAGTGEGMFNSDQVRGLGILKSSDKGVTWQALNNTQIDANFYWINRLAILNNATRVFAATHTGIFISDDGGVNWSNVYTGRSNDINVHPNDNSKLVASTWGKALYSNDGGLSWNTAIGLSSIGNGRIEIAYAKSNPAIVFASIDNNSGEVWKSSDGGQSYGLVNTGSSYLGGQGWYDNALWVDPLDENHLIVGGIDLWRSIDGGITFSKISTWWKSPSSPHADHHFIIEHPDYDGVNNKRVFFANDGGIYEAPDISVASDSNGWQELNNNLAITQFYGIGISPDGKIVGGTQDNGTLVYRGDSEGWGETYGGDGGFSAADPNDANYLYGEYVNLQIHRSTNGGINSRYIYTSAMKDDGPNFIAPLILDPNNENRMLAGAMQLWVSDDVKAATPSWTSMKTASETGVAISAIAVAVGTGDLIYVGHNDGSLFKTINGTSPTPSWIDISEGLPQRYLMRIVFDPIDANTLFVSFGGYESDNLWKSIDGGASWKISTGIAPNNIPPAPIRSIAIHNTRRNEIYVGTEVGIFTSDDGGDSWSLDNNGPANVSVDELVWGGSDILYAATHGRGVFRTNTRQDVPNKLNFQAKVDIPLSTSVESEPQIISGLGIEADISVNNGEYSLGCTGSYTSAAARTSNGDILCLRHTSSGDYWSKVITEITVGASSYNFESRSVADTSNSAGSVDWLWLLMLPLFMMRQIKTIPTRIRRHN